MSGHRCSSKLRRGTGRCWNEVRWTSTACREQDGVTNDWRSFVSPTASHPELGVKHHQTQEGTSTMRRQQVQEDDPLYPASSVCVGGYSEHPSHNTHVESSTEFLSNFPIQDFQSGICRSSRSARGRTEQNKTSASCLKTKKQSARPCGHQPPSGPHCCKACGKTFHYIYTLRAHARGHTADNVHVCGICGKHLGTSVNLISHLQSSKKGGGCGPQGKRFSNVKKHKACHWQILFAALKPPFQIICTYWSHWSRVVNVR